VRPCLWGKARRASKRVATAAARKADVFLEIYVQLSHQACAVRRFTAACVLCALVLGCASEPETAGARFAVALRQKGSVRAGDDQAMDCRCPSACSTSAQWTGPWPPHVPALIDCFERAGMHASTCQAKSFSASWSRPADRFRTFTLSRTKLGNYLVERCLIDGWHAYRVSSTRGQPQDRFRSIPCVFDRPARCACWIGG